MYKGMVSDILCGRVAANVDMHQMIDFISANAYIVAGQIGGGAGMVRNYHDLVSDLKVGAAVTVPKPLMEELPCAP